MQPHRSGHIMRLNKITKDILELHKVADIILAEGYLYSEILLQCFLYI
jgi:hypothetical protein